MGFAIVVLTTLSVLIFWASRPARSEAQLPSIALQHNTAHSDVPVRETLRVASYNIGYASGHKNNLGAILSEAEHQHNLSEIAATLRTLDADIIGLQEVDFDSARSFGVNQASYLAEALGMPYLAYVVTWNLTYLPWPYWPAHHHFGRIVSGQAVLSRYPIRSHEVHRFAKPADNPFWYNWFYLDRVAQALTIDVAGEAVALWHTHLDAFSNETRLQQARELGDMARQSPAQRQIILGDLNSTSFVRPGDEDWAEEGSESLRSLEHEYGFANAEGEAAYTFPSWDPMKKIDHILTRGSWQHQGVTVDTSSQASDHLPVAVQLKL